MKKQLDRIGEPELTLHEARRLVNLDELIWRERVREEQESVWRERQHEGRETARMRRHGRDDGARLKGER